MTNPTESVDVFLRFLEEETDMLKGIFRSPVGMLLNRMPIFGRDNWPNEKVEILRRLIERSLVRLAHLPPDEHDFALWLLVRRSGDTADKNLAELKDEYFQMTSVPILFLTES